MMTIIAALLPSSVSSYCFVSSNNVRKVKISGDGYFQVAARSCFMYVLSRNSITNWTTQCIGDSVSPILIAFGTILHHLRGTQLNFRSLDSNKSFRQEDNMAKRTSEDNGYVTKTLDYGKVYMDQHKETLEAMIARGQ
ncbi:hypothetical protein CY35_17G039400 [Sphagnum magellanicum]|nr:hypothetical protein CY35_17G039400 [Sphagnum magellanicum]